jgi:hypothetical protein
MKTMIKFYTAMMTTAILISGSVHAQHVNIGIKGGLNVFNIHNDNGVKYDAKTGLHLGLLGHIHLDKEWAVQPEIVYSSQGAKYNFANSETRVNLDYINVPVLLQYMFDNGFRFEAGPQVGFLINAKTGNKIDVIDNYKSIDFGLGLGIGYIKPSTGLGIDARYNLGLSDITENNSVKSTNRGFQLGVFYQFKHK